MAGTGSTTYTEIYGYRGIFNGNGFKIKNLYIDDFLSNTYSVVGLFGSIADGEVKNLTVSTNEIGVLSRGESIGILCGNTGENSKISNCHTSGNIGLTDELVALYPRYSCGYIGGIIGIATSSNTTIENCTSNAKLFGREYIGGIIGFSIFHSGNLVNNCSFSGEIKGCDCIGGIIGMVRYYMYEDDANLETPITNCNVTGSIIGTPISDEMVAQIGGVIGYIIDSYGDATIPRIAKCSFNGTIEITSVNGGYDYGGYCYGGFIGYIGCGVKQLVIKDCYSSGEIRYYESPDPMSTVGGFTNISDYARGCKAINCYSSTKMIKINPDSSMPDAFTKISSDLSFTSENCYWLNDDIQIPGLTSETATALTLTQMKQQSSFNNWDFVNTWQINEGVSLPTLR